MKGKKVEFKKKKNENEDSDSSRESRKTPEHLRKPSIVYLDDL